MKKFNKRYWPYQSDVVLNASVAEVARWCYNNFKSRNWRHAGYYFVFKNSQDATAFLLRWR